MEPVGEKSNYICYKGHEFIPTLYHFPTNCEACMKPLWHMFKPPPALECRRCHIKCHKDHLDRKEEIVAPCKGEWPPAPQWACQREPASTDQPTCPSQYTTTYPPPRTCCC